MTCVVLYGCLFEWEMTLVIAIGRLRKLSEIITRVTHSYQPKHGFNFISSIVWDR